MTTWLRETAAGLSIAVLATPRASKTELTGVVEGRLKIRLAAPPVDGAANDELVRFLAKALEVPPSRVAVVAGSAGRRKTVVVEGVAVQHARRLLEK